MKIIYYKNYKVLGQNMDIAALIVLRKLDNYREAANRERVILPIDSNIKLFTDVIDECVKFFN